MLAPVRCHGRPSQVQPISTRRFGGLSVAEAGASDDAAGVAQHGGERERRAGLLLRERRTDVALHAGAIVDSA